MVKRERERESTETECVNKPNKWTSIVNPYCIYLEGGTQKNCIPGNACIERHYGKQENTQPAQTEMKAINSSKTWHCMWCKECSLFLVKSGVYMGIATITSKLQN